MPSKLPWTGHGLQAVGVVVAVRERGTRSDVGRDIARAVIRERPDSRRVSDDGLQLVVGRGVGVQVRDRSVGFAGAIAHAVEYPGLAAVSAARAVQAVRGRIGERLAVGARDCIRDAGDVESVPA